MNVLRRSLAALALASFALLVPAPAGARTAAATGGCRAIGGGTLFTGGGSHRATVVVDTGSGPVWSACVTFDGTISGIDALQAAKDEIPDLAPQYDTYTGEGRAVCKLRGVGNDPPDCLGKSAAYWGYYRNGRYSRSGAGSSTVSDGDVEGWRWGTSASGPRAATNGYEAVAAPPPVTTTTTTRPTTGGSHGGTVTTTTPSSGGGMSGNPGDPISAGTTPTTPGGATTTTRPGSSPTTTKPGTTTTTAKGSGDEPVSSNDSGSKGSNGSNASHGSSDADPSPESGNGSESAEPPPKTVGSKHDSGSSAASSAVSFGLVLAGAVGLGVYLRRRRRPTVG